MGIRDELREAAIRACNNMCECSDPGCPVHKGRPVCEGKARRTVKRIDMEDETGTRMCSGCAADAMDSGVFR